MALMSGAVGALGGRGRDGERRLLGAALRGERLLAELSGRVEGRLRR